MTEPQGQTRVQGPAARRRRLYQPLPPPGTPGGGAGSARSAAPGAPGVAPPLAELAPRTQAGERPDGRPPEPRRRGPLGREAAWGWGGSLAGLAAAFGPELLLYAVALGAGASTAADGKVTTGSAVALVVVSLLIYGWHTLAAWFFSVRVAGRRLAAWGFRLPTRAYFWTIPVGLMTVYAVTIAHEMVVNPREQDIVGQFPRTPAGIALFVVLAVVLAPLFEEVFFRGFLFRGLSASWGWMAGALVSSGVFGIAHAQLDVFVPLFALGLVLAWVYQRTGSLWTSISLHALFNGISVLAWALTG